MDKKDLEEGKREKKEGGLEVEEEKRMKIFEISNKLLWSEASKGEICWNKESSNGFKHT